MSNEPGFVKFEEDLDDLAEELVSFAESDFEDFTIIVERYHPDQHSWNLHSFKDGSDDALDAVKRHLKSRRDVIKLKEDGRETPVLLISRPHNTGLISKYISSKDIGDLDNDSTLIVAPEKDRVESFLNRFD